MTDSQKQIDAIRQARAILERWQSSDLLDQIQSTEEIPPLVWSSECPQRPSRHDEPAPVNPPPHDQSTDSDASALTVRTSEAAGNADVSPVESPAAVNAGGSAEPHESPGTMVSGESHASELEVPQTSRGNPEATLPIRRPRGRPAVQRRARPAGHLRKDAPGMPDMNRTLRFDAGAAKTSGSTPASTPEDLRAAAAADLAFAVGALPESETADTAAGTRLDRGEPAVELVAAPVSNASASVAGRRVRIDPPESVDVLAETSDGRTRTHGKTRQRYIDEAHAGGLSGPHFQVTLPRRPNLTSLTGQFLAYLGVLGLTVGTAIVIYGHFGGYAEYTPTGWLITTVAQMLLFLGIINLVSGGIEQNNQDVSRRIHTLGEQLRRIEQVTEQALRGPKLPPSLYQTGQSSGQSPVRQDPVRQDGITVP